MRYRCGNCGAPAPGDDRCVDPACPGPIFDLDTQAGLGALQDYRALTRDRQTDLALVTFTVFPIVTVLMIVPVVTALLGGGDLVDDVGSYVFWAGAEFLIAASWFVVGARFCRRPAALRALDFELATATPGAGDARPASPRASSPAR